MRALLTALLLLASPVLATCAPRASGEAAIWRIVDADSEIWLFGTAHMLRPDVRWRGPRFEAAFGAAEELVTETDTSPAATEAIATLSETLGTLPEGQTLNALLSEEDRTRFEQACAALRIDPEGLQRMRPWLAALRISYAYALDRGMRPESGVESVLSAEARQRGLRFSFLETPEQQIHILADLPPEEEARFLRDTLRETESDSELEAAMDELWARGDTARLATVFDTQWRATSPAIREAIILQRNRAWADQIEQRLAGDGRVFIAVGAAHLLGEGNVIALLRERGIAVEGP